MLFCSKSCKIDKCFWVVYMSDGTGQKNGRGWKKREESHFYFFIELLLEHVTLNEPGAFGIPPDKGNRVTILHIPFFLKTCFKNPNNASYWLDNYKQAEKFPKFYGYWDRFVWLSQNVYYGHENVLQ